MATEQKKESKVKQVVTIAPPNMQHAEFEIVGTAPYVGNRFSGRKREQMLAAQMTTGAAKTGKKKKEPRDPEKDYEGATHRGPNNELGIPASGFRCALISACRLVGFQMTRAKLSIFITADFYDDEDGTPLVRIKGKRRMHDGSVRLESGVTSVAFRPMWEDWSATVRVSYDADQFTLQDVANLMRRAGMQVGIGEGRPDSKKSNGCGWGTFDLKM